MKDKSHQNINLKYALRRANGIPLETDLRPYRQVLAAIKAYDFTRTAEAELKATAENLRHRARQGERLEDLLAAVYALAGEICSRKLGLPPFEVQFLAGVVLHLGKLAQMQTGEGKTLAAVLPAVLNALTGKGVHIMTANDYLARRDAEWMKPVYDFFGLQTAYICENMPAADRQAAYRADITYLTAREAGFDLLRDQLCYQAEDTVQRAFHYALLDEADFILIDEARIPLVIAGFAPTSGPDPCRIEALIPRLVQGSDFRLDRAGRSVNLTLAGQQKVEQLLGCGGIEEEESLPLYAAVHVALLAHYLLMRDVDYIVRRGKIELVDQFTGRVADKRRWPYGIQHALEAKEGLTLQPEGRIFGSITIQHFIGLYPRVAALTATAVSAAQELDRNYGLATVIIPPHKPVIRVDAPDRVYRTHQGKINALLAEIGKIHATGQPLLIGTGSIKESQELAARLADAQLPCQVLNAKNDEREAELVARAGLLGAVTIATNMAGRGTDIKLGGEAGLEREKIRQLGGLYVLGTNRHESVRIDNQLRGRAGRQGDPGRSCFFVSLEDPLMEKYGVREFIPAVYLKRTGEPDEQPITDDRVAAEIARAQSIIEEQNSRLRRTLRKYSEFVEQQRQYFQRTRRQALEAGLVPDELAAVVGDHARELLETGGPHKVRDFKAGAVRIYLHYLDSCWAEHLLVVDELKEGLELQGLGGVDPLQFFLKNTSADFTAGLQAACDRASEAVSALAHANGAAGRQLEKFKAPTSTWTYLINDNPLPAFRLAVLAGRRNRWLVWSILASIFLSLLVSLLYALLKYI